jgi:hypothetical protein
MQAHCKILDRGYDKEEARTFWIKACASEIRKGTEPVLAIMYLRNIMETMVFPAQYTQTNW